MQYLLRHFIRIPHYHYSQFTPSIASTLKNLSPSQLTQFNQLISNDDEKKLKLIAYLVQKLKPGLIPYKQILLQQIRNNSIESNQDLEYAIKLIQKIQNPEFYLNEYINTIQEKRIHSFIIQINQKYPGLCSNEQLIKIKEQFPECTQEMIIKLNQNKQNQSKQQIYQKIQTFTPRDIPEQHNLPEQLEKHKCITQGKIVLRFPPEPNGYLHLGHVRSIRLNFYSAEQLNGYCYLRYDDTNPANEKQIYIDEIEHNVKWFGHKPTHITYASDYFPFIFDCAIKLIKDNKAFICEQNRDEMKEYRRNKQPSPYRDRNIDESLRIFNEMQEGKHPESKYTLRLKIDYQHANPTLRDPVIYRVLYTQHPKSGDKWKVYPMYDFAHCICDSLENITHSLCTLEFEIRRELYYWILTNLNLYKPFVYEFSRLNVSNNMLSKRKIGKMIEMGIVNGWDDPRLLTLAGLRKRGYTPQAINEFIDQVSVPRGGNEQIISIKLLENCIRKELEKTVPKIMAILNPILIDVEIDKNTIKQVYVQQDDVKLVSNPDFYGLTPNKQVCLRFFGVILCEDIILEYDKVKYIKVKLISTDINERKKLQGQINWLDKNDCITGTVNEYSYLFDTENPAEIQEFWNNFNKNSLQIYDVKVPKQLEYKVGDRFQFERNGFYIVDSIKDGHIYFNKIVGLVEGEKKNLK
ncbi:unnamed protein product [Paramecium pentaurelia]|uniref:Glutamine--tRNA ligase n=1 Tax=Paramecium pentaurelia TaxID=43138 RepID=A0A8S1VH30_9CILI|nr:unnamed protein product [Paramecium pentaurelia]